MQDDNGEISGSAEDSAGSSTLFDEDAFPDGDNPPGEEAEFEQGPSEAAGDGAFGTADGGNKPAEVGVSQKVNNVYGDAIGQINYYEDEAGRLIVTPIPLAAVERLTAIFPIPKAADYQRALKRAQLKGDRIFIVHGSEGSGKLTCAVNLAFDLQGSSAASSRICLYQRRVEEVRFLFEAMQSEEIPEGSVVIIEDVFDRNVARRELENPEIETVKETLGDRGLFLILTTELDHAGLGAFPVPKISTRRLDLKKITLSHLKYAQKRAKGNSEKKSIEDAMKWVESRWSDLSGLLHSPREVEQLCEKITNNPPLDEADFIKLVEQSVIAGKVSFRNWFGRLRSNEKLFSMLVYLCPGTEYPFLAEIYERAVRFLRSEGLSWFSDPRRLGSEDLLKAIEGEEIGGFIDFKERSFKEEVCAQTQNWSHLLWSIITNFVTGIDPDVGWTNPQLRKALGAFMGRLSVHGGMSFDGALNRLAGHPSRRISVIVGYSLEEAVARHPETQTGLALRKLSEWIESDEPNSMWAACAAIRKVYASTRILASDPRRAEGALALQDRLLKLLERFVLRCASIERQLREELKKRPPSSSEAEKKPKVIEESRRKLRAMAVSNPECAIDAAQRIVSLDPARSSLLGDWLRQRKERALRNVAKWAIARIFKGLSNPKKRLLESRYAPVLDLIEPMLEGLGESETNGKVIDQVFSTLAVWLRWPSWPEAIFKKLLTIANRGSHDVRGKLRAALSRLWMSGGNADRDVVARNIAQAVIVRSYVMDGVLMDRPSFGRGVFVLDPAILTGDEEKRKRQEEGCRYLLGLLAAQVDASFVHLGSIEPVRVVDEKAVVLMAEHPVPRLLIPAVQAAGTEDLRLVLLLSGGVIPDLEDALGEPWGGELLRIAVGEDAEPCEGVETISIKEELGAREIAQVEETLQTRWARALALAGPQAWADVLDSFGIWEELKANPRAWLEEWVEGLGDTDQALGTEDLARKLLCALGWYAAFDLRSCAGLLRTWLPRPEDGDGDGVLVRRWMGAAGAKALFRIYGEHRSAHGNLALRILFEELAHPLAAQGSDGVDSVLRAVRTWLQEPEGAAYLAGGVVEGRGRLLRWAEEFVPRQVAALAASLPEVLENPVVDVATDPFAAAAAMLDRMRLQFALGRPKILPELNAGESYGLIVLDASGTATLETLAGKLFESLNGDGRRIKPIVYRLGERQPAWLAGDPAPPPGVLMPAGNRPPRLLGPILSDGLSPDTVRFLLVLSLQPPLDVEDWIETDWRDRIVFYQPGSNENRKPGFAALPALNGGNPASAIARFLLHRLGGEVLEGFGSPAAETNDPSQGALVAG
jgi:hypothetical protein